MVDLSTTQIIDTLTTAHCHFDGCVCSKYKFHKFKPSLVCIECGHLAEFHDIPDDVAEECLSKKASRLILPMTTNRSHSEVQSSPQTASNSRSDPSLDACEQILSNHLQIQVVVEDEVPGGVDQPVDDESFARNLEKTIKFFEDEDRLTRKQTQYLLQTTVPDSCDMLATMMAPLRDFNVLMDLPFPPLFTNHRGRAVHELYKTEQQYVKSLMFVMKSFHDPMFDHPNFTVECQALFMCLPEILNLNQHLLEALHNNIMTWSDTSCIGNDLLTFCPFLRIYQVYCSFYESATRRVRTLMSTSQAFSNLCEVNRHDPESRGLDLCSFLVMPVQRVPRYLLLVQEIAKNTPEGHPDKDAIQNALENFKQLSSAVNEGIRERENRTLIFEIQCQFSTGLQLVESHRRFIHRGSLSYIETGDPIWRQCFLFSDLFVVSRRLFDGLLGEVHVHNLADIMFVPSLSYLQNAFGIRTRQVSYILQCDSQEKYHEWVSAFKSELQSLQRRNSSVIRIKSDQGMSNTATEFMPIWQPDHSSLHCMICKNAFGLLTRRHHCRFCGLLVCDSCSPTQLLSFSSDQRKCTDCRKTSQESSATAS
eukprot:TRINITY_DN4703_c0_g1_i1.p1 TRINITY_DN4703_c0_g1~~TRINITY_DN4703_c0_g1_i1.p1  ORF type:complete len:592 (-),score=82.56 TRINITY_DN4703_c0_g1_i1:423-2198(-)